jgi:hypothetical protein
MKAEHLVASRKYLAQSLNPYDEPRPRPGLVGLDL